MDVWTKPLVDVLINDDILDWGLQIVSSDGNWYVAIMLRWYFKGDFTPAMLPLLFTIPSVS